MIAVLDSSALIAFLKDEKGADVVESVLSDTSADCSVHAINLCEVYYDLAREYGDKRALQGINALMAFDLGLHEDMDLDFWRQAGNYKAKLVRVSLADCFCLALAHRKNGEIITADHEFYRAVERRICKITFIR